MTAIPAKIIDPPTPIKSQLSFSITESEKTDHIVLHSFLVRNMKKKKKKLNETFEIITVILIFNEDS